MGRASRLTGSREGVGRPLFRFEAGCLVCNGGRAAVLCGATGAVVLCGARGCTREGTGSVKLSIAAAISSRRMVG